MTANEKIKDYIGDINLVSSFLASRDIPYLDRRSIFEGHGNEQADLLILMVSAVLYVNEEAAAAFKRGVSKKIMVVGGIGHSTGYLRDTIKAHPIYKDIEVEGRSEADIIKDVFVKHLGIAEKDILVENQSTNCGANAALAMDVIKKEGASHETVILMQDPTMQLRTYASFLQQWKSEDTHFINYSAFVPEVDFFDGRLQFVNNIGGLWDMERFLSLIKGEIPRLTDDEKGYGPRGAGFIAHVDIPPEVLKAYGHVQPLLSDLQR